MSKDFCIANIFGCFPAGTKVTTSGGLKPIEEIQVGDEVKAYDFVNNEWAIRKVGNTFKRAYFGGLVSAQVEGETIQSTFHHPFWIVRGKDLETRRLLDHLPPAPEGCQTEDRWVDACDMRVGDEVLLADGRIVPIQGISYSPFEGDVYNFQVEDLHCFAISSAQVLVHNAYQDNLLDLSGLLPWIQKGIPRNELPLTAAQISMLKTYAGQLGIKPGEIEYLLFKSVYSDLSKKILIGPDVFPAGINSLARSVYARLTPRSVIAHEAGHMIAHKAGKGIDGGGLLEEIQACLIGRQLNGLSNIERRMLLRYPAEMAREADYRLRDLLGQLPYFKG